MLVNAVRITHPDGRLWVTDPTSMGAWGRREAPLAVSDPLSFDDAVRIGTQYLAYRKDPSVSVQVTIAAGTLAGTDYQVGDSITVEGVGEQRVVDVKQTLDPDTGLWLPETPVLSSPADRERRAADRAFDRLIAQQGRGWPDADTFVSKSPIPSGPLADRGTLSWSWYDPDGEVLEDDDNFQVHQIERPVRAWALSCHPDFTGATGDTTIELHRNAALWNGLFNIVVPATPPGIPWVWIPMYGGSVLNPGDQMSIRCIQNGKHKQGSVALYLTDPV